MPPGSGPGTVPRLRDGPSAFRHCESRRMGGAKRYPSVSVFVSDGFRSALPILRIRLRDLAAHCARGLHLRLSLQNLEGAGKTGCLLHPRSRVRFAQTKGHTSIQGSWSIPAFPAQWLYGLLRALPGERLSCLRHSRKLAFANLAPAPRRPNHTTSPYAQAAHVSRSFRVHRISPRVRDDGQRPSSAVRQAELCD